MLILECSNCRKSQPVTAFAPSEDERQVRKRKRFDIACEKLMGLLPQGEERPQLLEEIDLTRVKQCWDCRHKVQPHQEREAKCREYIEHLMQTSECSKCGAVDGCPTIQLRKDYQPEPGCKPLPFYMTTGKGSSCCNYWKRKDRGVEALKAALQSYTITCAFCSKLELRAPDAV